MIKTLAIILALVGGAYAMTTMFIGYPKAGKYYISDKRAKQSLRTGSAIYGSRYYGSRSFRGGK